MMLFKTVFVFDRAQVDPIDGREQAPLGRPKFARYVDCGLGDQPAAIRPT